MLAVAPFCVSGFAPSLRATTSFAQTAASRAALEAVAPGPLPPIAEKTWKTLKSQFDRSPSEQELNALFFRFDYDSSGGIDRKELTMALEQLGYDIAPEKVSALFDALDTSGAGTIGLEEFKVLVGRIGIKAESGLDYAMDLFSKYDYDNSGMIDKQEFQSLAKDLESNNQRRTVLQLMSAVVGSLVVAKSSDTFQFGQRNLRTYYYEPRAEASQKKIFPTALLSADMDERVFSTLAGRGFNAKNTLFAHSVCSDEVNNKKEQLLDLMVRRWGEGFTLGGLGGVPFVGKSGFRAYLHHVPDNGKLLVMFAPHVGIDGEGRIGALQREGQDALSKACGAAIGSFKAIGAQKAAMAKADGQVLEATKADTSYDEFDPQIQQIIQLLEPRLEGIEDSANDIAFVTYQLYGIVRDLVDACIAGTPDVWEWTNEVALVGGIMINRKNGGDFFQPLSFETRTKGKSVDLFEETFGPRPNLVPVLGSASVATGVYGEDKLSELAKSLRTNLPTL